MRIIDLDAADEAAIQRCAELLVEGFREQSPSAWPDLPTALEEVRECLEPDKITRVAVDERGMILGWVGARHNYAKVWELHPLVVRPDRQRQGIGRCRRHPGGAYRSEVVSRCARAPTTHSALAH